MCRHSAVDTDGFTQAAQGRTEGPRTLGAGCQDRLPARRASESSDAAWARGMTVLSPCALCVHAEKPEGSPWAVMPQDSRDASARTTAKARTAGLGTWTGETCQDGWAPGRREEGLPSRWRQAMAASGRPGLQGGASHLTALSL